MKTITCVCHDNECHDPLIYTVTVNDPSDLTEVHNAVIAERKRDLGEDQEPEMQVMFAFAGDISPVADWRE